MKKSFKNFLAVVPLLAPIWESRPPTEQDLELTYPILADQESVLFQASGMDYLDSALQLMVLHNFGQTNHPLAAEFLLEFIDQSDDPELITVALSQLPRLPLDRSAAVRAMVPLLDHADAGIRFWSHRLIADLPAPSREILGQIVERAQYDPEAKVRTAARLALKAHARELEYSQVTALTRLAPARARADGWAVAVASRDGLENDPGEVMEAAINDPSALVRQGLLVNIAGLDYAFAHRLRQSMHTDSHPSVRTAVATTARPPRQPRDWTVNIQTDQAILLQLVDDDNPETRRAASESLAFFPARPVVEALVEKFSDHTRFVRWQAEESIVRLADKIELAEMVAKRLADDSPDARFHVYNVLARIDAREYAAAILDGLGRESHPKLIAAAITALHRLEHHAGLVTIARFYRNRDARVREAVATAMGVLGNRSINSQLAELIHDSSQSVRQAAITAAGHLRDPFFTPYLLTILQDTRNIIQKYSISDRIAVCWAAPRLDPIPNNLMARIKQHATEKIVASEDEMLYDYPAVMASAYFAFVDAARRDDRHVSTMRELTEFFRRTGGPGYPGDEITSPLLEDIVRQAMAWYRGQLDIEPVPTPSRLPSLIYQRIR